jgi:hypothetical protein
MDAVAFWSLLGILALANLVASAAVVRSSYYSAGQKWAQCIVVWLLPLLGAVGIWAFLRSQERGNVFDTRAFPERAERMEEPEPDSSVRDDVVDNSQAIVENGS